MVLEAIYEQDFHFRLVWLPSRPQRPPGAGCAAEGAHAERGWILDHGALRSFLDERVTDGVLRRAIGKWLRAGVLEQGAVTHPDRGTPQGGVTSPLLASVFLHRLLDLWFEREVKPRLRGRVTLSRYADDCVVVLQQGADARRVRALLPKQLGKQGVLLHPDKRRPGPWETRGRFPPRPPDWARVVVRRMRLPLRPPR